MATIILTATTEGGTSAEFAVTTTPVSVGLFSGEEDESFCRVKAKIEQEVDTDVWQPLCDGDVTKRNSSGTYLYMTKRSYTIKTPGTYRVVKDATEKLIGVYTDGTSG